MPGARLLAADWFPDGVLIRLSQKEGRVWARWQYRGRWFQIDGKDLFEVVKEALQAVAALEHHGGPV